MKKCSVAIVNYNSQLNEFIKLLLQSDNFNIACIFVDKTEELNVKENKDLNAIPIFDLKELNQLKSGVEIIIKNRASEEISDKIRKIAPSSTIVLNESSSKIFFNFFIELKKEFTTIESAYNLSKKYANLMEDSNTQLDSKIFELSLLNEASKVFSSSAFDERNITNFIYLLLRKKINFSILVTLLTGDEKRSLILTSKDKISEGLKKAILERVNKQSGGGSAEDLIVHEDVVGREYSGDEGSKMVKMEESNLKEIYGSPIIVGERKLGYIGVVLLDKDSITEDDKRFFDIITNQIALFIENERIKQIITNERNRLDSILQNIAGVLLVVDTKKNILLVNQMVETIWNTNRSLMINKEISETIPCEELEQLIDELLSSDLKFLTGDRRVFNERSRCEIDVRVNLAKVYDFLGNIIGVVIVLYDITKEKEIEKMKSEIVSVASHELKSPLASIMQSVDLVLDSLSDDERMRHGKFLDIASRNASKLIDIINNLLDISRIESGRFELNISRININNTINDAITTLNPLAYRKKIALKSELDATLPPLPADNLRLSEVLNNLLSNALKFTREGGSVTIKTSFYKDDPSFAEISVSDTGVGIDEKDFDRVFAKFERIRNPGFEHIGGTGLGMAITREIINMHRGKIWIESTYGKGSTFHFILPVEMPNST